jgi:hypothetical protein
MRWLLQDAAIPYTIVFTKANRVSLPLVIKQVNDVYVRYASRHNFHNDGDDDYGGGGIAQSPIEHVSSSKYGCFLLKRNSLEKMTTTMTYNGRRS